MTPEEFRNGLDRYGADLARWPAEPAGEARALLSRDAGAARALAVAERLDAALLRLAQPSAVSSAEIGRVLARLADDPASSAGFRPSGRLVTVAAAAVAVCLATGFALGLAAPADGSDTALAALIFGTGEPSGGLL